jgi:hypothetical protein
MSKKIQELPQEVSISLDQMMAYCKEKLSAIPVVKTRAKRAPLSEDQKAVLVERAKRAREAKVAKKSQAGDPEKG